MSIDNSKPRDSNRSIPASKSDERDAPKPSQTQNHKTEPEIGSAKGDKPQAPKPRPRPYPRKEK